MTKTADVYIVDDYYHIPHGSIVQMKESDGTWTDLEILTDSVETEIAVDLIEHFGVGYRIISPDGVELV